MAHDLRHEHKGDHRHDWHSQSYVADWIERDTTRASARGQILDHMLVAASFDPDAEIAVLDVGAGAGAVSQAVVKAFPRAVITLQDYSGPMLDRARERFGERAAKMQYVLCDLRDPKWDQKVGGPFDLAVSAIAIHNLYEMSAITACYGAVRRLLKAGGCFLDCDHFDRAGGLAAHCAALRSVGFAHVETVWHETPTAVLKAIA